MAGSQRGARFLVAATLLAASLPGMARAAPAETLAGRFAAEHGAGGAVSGAVTGRFDPGTDVLRWRATYAGLSGPVVAAHFHGPATPPAEAGVMSPIAPPYASPLAGTWHLTEKQAAALKAGEVYLNLHTAAFPNGEARADLSLR